LEALVGPSAKETFNSHSTWNERPSYADVMADHGASVRQSQHRAYTHI
jgi:hypothetical protein